MINRRDLLKYSVVTATAFTVGIAAKKYAFVNTASTETYKVFEATINHLFRDQDGYVTSKLNIIGYFKAILQDKRIDIERREYLINGVRWLDESAQEDYGLSFLELTHEQKEALFQKIKMLRWGDNWMYKMMSYYFEATLSDPIYGGNINGIGWKWLAFEPGFPRPNEVAI